MPTKTQAKTTAKKSVTLRWSTSRYAPVERSLAWYIIGSLFVGGLILQGLWTHNWLFVLLVCGCSWLYIKDHLHNDEIWNVELSQDALVINGTSLDWSNWNTAWFVRVPERTELHIAGPLNRYRHLTIPLGDANPSAVQKLLPAHITVVEDKTETKLDMIARFLKI